MRNTNRLRRDAPAAILVLGAIFAPGIRAQTEADFISTPSEVGSPTFHYHLVNPGSVTTYLIEVKNIWDNPVDVELGAESDKDGSWSVSLSESKVSRLMPDERRAVTLTLRPSEALGDGEVLQVKLTAVAENDFADVCKVAAQTASHQKVYFVSIDSLHPAYLQLNAAGAGPGKDGDRLMPNLHRLQQRSVFYPNAKAHIISATDMNHFNFLAGTMTGTSGIPLVATAFFGFDEKGKPITVANRNLKSEITIYGEGKKVKTIFNSAKTFNPRAWTAFVSGKGWVPEMMKFPDYQLDRVITGAETPEWANPIPGGSDSPAKQLRSLLRALLARPGKKAHQLGNPENLPEPQDRRENYPLAKLMNGVPSQFPPDKWVMDAALKVLENEDPDVFYVLLAAVDDAGHAYGSAFDPEEWDSRGTATLKDDVSQFDSRASRQGILNVVREADKQLGRLLDLLEERGSLDKVILVAESDHAMVTHYRKSLALGERLKKAGKFDSKADYFFGGASSVGMVANKTGNPAVMADVEAALESWQVKNPVTGRLECPVIVYNREEMKTGFDQATGKQWMLPNEYYSAYYVEHRKPGQVQWVDLLILTAPNYKFRLEGVGLGNLGMTSLPIKLPKWGFFIGGHGSFDTQPCLLMVSAPGVKPAVRQDQVYAMDLAPAIERIEGWQIPESTDGKGLPGLEPETQQTAEPIPPQSN